MTKDLAGARRRAARLPVQISGSLSGRAPRPVTIADLSLTGCLVRCEALLDHGAILDLRTVLDGEPFVAKVRVTGASVDGAPQSAEDPRCLAGLEFLSLPPLQAARLRRFIEQERQRRRGANPSAE
jgi:c-di-GMP-binding flagellar brake protein YcgR